MTMAQSLPIVWSLLGETFREIQKGTAGVAIQDFREEIKSLLVFWQELTLTTLGMTFVIDERRFSDGDRSPEGKGERIAGSASDIGESSCPNPLLSGVSFVERSQLRLVLNEEELWSELMHEFELSELCPSVKALQSIFLGVSAKSSTIRSAIDFNCNGNLSNSVSETQAKSKRETESEMVQETSIQDFNSKLVEEELDMTLVRFINLSYITNCMNITVFFKCFS